jgi:hypothetical protein
MTKRLPCPPAPGPLEAYAERFDDRLGTLAQRRGFREYLPGLLLPRDRHTTLTGLVGTEPVVGAQAASVQRLQFFLSESPWDVEAVNRRRLELVVTDPATAPHAAGVLVIDDSDDSSWSLLEVERATVPAAPLTVSSQFVSIVESVSFIEVVLVVGEGTMSRSRATSVLLRSR